MIFVVVFKPGTRSSTDSSSASSSESSSSSSSSSGSDSSSSSESDSSTSQEGNNKKQSTPEPKKSAPVQKAAVRKSTDAKINGNNKNSTGSDGKHQTKSKNPPTKVFNVEICNSILFLLSFRYQNNHQKRVFTHLKTTRMLKLQKLPQQQLQQQNGRILT